jgi:hypothetical protein
MSLSRPDRKRRVRCDNREDVISHGYCEGEAIDLREALGANARIHGGKSWLKSSPNNSLGNLELCGTSTRKYF